MTAQRDFSTVQRFTYADYIAWDDDVRRELIYGEPVAMAAPSSAHQQISMNLSAILYLLLRGKKCRPLASPLDVRLNYLKGDDIVVQPDLVVICDPRIIDEAGVKGVPSMIVEILSPSTMMHDRITKLQIYRDAGVPEYWIVDPKERTITVHLLSIGEKVTYSRGVVPVGVIDDGVVDFDSVFEYVIYSDTPTKAN